MSEAVKFGAGARSGANPGTDANVQMNGLVGRMLVRAVWHQEWILANPEGTAETRKAAWKDARDGSMDKNLKAYRRAIGVLRRSGVMISLSDDVADDEAE